MKKTFFVIIFLIGTTCLAQYQFSGKVNTDMENGKLYLSMIEDYRKLSGVYSEQILSKTIPDSMGSFHFEGDNLPLENRIYRIHIDMCSDEDQALNHFSGHCANSKEILFIANNTDTLSFPFTENNEMFCKVVAPNEKSEIFLKIDSLKNDMKYAFAAYRSEVNKKLNTQKWFKSLLDYGKSLDEPLAELYVYAYVSDRSNDFHQHYLEDLKKITTTIC